MATWCLESVEVSGGFLAGLRLPLRGGPGLTCIIGPRGSGKSTLVEVIRYGMGGPRGANKSRLEFIQANLGPSLITLRTAQNKDGQSYVISRRYGQPATITTPDGRALPGVDMERGTFLPIDAYSSPEIEAIAEESLGDKRRALIDELQESEYQALLVALAGERRALEANADAIKSVRQRIMDLTERIEERRDARARLASMPPPTAHDDASKILTRVSAQRKTNKQEEHILNAAFKHYGALLDELKRLESGAADAFGNVQIVQGSENGALMEQAKSVVHETLERLHVLSRDILKFVGENETKLQEIMRQHSKSQSKQDALYANLQTKNAEASSRIQARADAEAAVAALDNLEADRDAARVSEATLVQQRLKLKGAYLLERGNISSSRDAIAKRLENEIGQRVRIRVLRNADNLTYKNMLLDGLKGARVRNHEDILMALLCLRPEELAEMIELNNVSELATQTQLGEERSRKILESFRASISPFKLEVVEIEDRIAIELNVGTSGEANFKDASELSRGQKCTALLPLLLARRDTPLIIDQPEDNLDNHFIYETIVNTITRLKGSRQMVFVTHNANIPVLAEADLVVVMNSDGRRGYISKMGSVDDCRSDIVDLLEGGRQAFDLRRQRYER